MLKIVIARRGAETTALHLEGQIVGPWVAELERVCEPLVNGNEALELDLSLVSFVSRDGLDLLARMRARDARLVNCSGFVAEQLRTNAERDRAAGAKRA